MCQATVCDVSATTLNRLPKAAESERISHHRLHSFIFDASKDPRTSQHPLRGLGADAVMW